MNQLKQLNDLYFIVKFYGSKATISNLSSCGMNKNYYKFFILTLKWLPLKIKKIFGNKKKSIAQSVHPSVHKCG